MESELLPIELHITLSDIINGDGHVDDLFPYFYQHATTMFPHLTCLEELKTICDLSRPMNWYPEARGLTRRIIYHAGQLPGCVWVCLYCKLSVSHSLALFSSPHPYVTPSLPYLKPFYA